MHVAALQRSQWWSADKVQAYQRSRLGRMLAFATAQVPHYRNLGLEQGAGFGHGKSGDGGAASNPGQRPTSNPGPCPEDWLQRFPILTKQALQASGDRLLAHGVDKQRLFSSRTSGSTGEPTVSYFDRSAWLMTKYAFKLRRMLNFGLGLGSRVLIVSEASEDKLLADRKAVMPGQGLLFQQHYQSLHTPLSEHVRQIQAFKPHAIYAFPSYFSDLLDYCRSRNVALPRVDVVFTSSEIMPAALSQQLRSFLGARVSDIYGCTEFKELAWQCEAGTYHTNFESAFIECLPGDEGIQHGVGHGHGHVPGRGQPETAFISLADGQANGVSHGPGGVLLTTLVNYASPLIRYRVGDLGELAWERCACGREGPVLRNLAGREVDMLELPDGQRLSPYLLTTAVEDVPGLRQYQFVQTAPARIELRYAMQDGQAAPDHELLRARLQNLLQRRMDLGLVPVAAIARTAGGKRKVFVRID